MAGRGFFTHEQVADTMALLALVENPFNEEALIRVLASPYIGAGDDDLLALRRAAGDVDAEAGGWPATGALWPAVTAVEAARPLATVVEGLRPLLRERGLAGPRRGGAVANGYDLAVLGLPDGPAATRTWAAWCGWPTPTPPCGGPTCAASSRCCARWPTRATRTPARRRWSTRGSTPSG